MEVFRRFAAEAPQPREFPEDKPTLIMSWVCYLEVSKALLLLLLCSQPLDNSLRFPVTVRLRLQQQCFLTVSHVVVYHLCDYYHTTSDCRSVY